MAELADAADSKSAEGNLVGVRPPLPAPIKSRVYQINASPDAFFCAQTVPKLMKQSEAARGLRDRRRRSRCQTSPLGRGTHGLQKPICFSHSYVWALFNTFASGPRYAMSSPRCQMMSTTWVVGATMK